MIERVLSTPMKYDAETRAKAIRLSPSTARTTPVSTKRSRRSRVGWVNPETLRKWLRQGEIDSGDRDGTTTTSAREIRELKRKNAELEQTIEILKAATSFFVRESDPRRR